MWIGLEGDVILELFWCKNEAWAIIEELVIVHQ